MADLREAKEAIKDLFEQYGTEVYQYVRYSLGDQTLAEDVLQEIFLRALEAWPRFENRSSPRTWLWSIVRHHLRDVIRKKRRVRDSQSSSFESLEGSVSSENSFELIELESIVQSLPVAYRQVVVLRIIQGQSTQEVAQILGWSEVKVRVTLHRAIKKLQKTFLEEQMVTDFSKTGGDRNGFEGSSAKTSTTGGNRNA